MGHIHAPQPVPGAPVPAEYAGSLLPLDFGEAGEQKRVVIVDVEPGRLATVESVPLHERTPARARRRHLGRAGGARRGAVGVLPRPHGAGRRHRHGPGPTRGGGLPVPRERAAPATGRRAHPRAGTRRRDPPTRSCTPSTTGARPARTRPRSCWPSSARSSRRSPMRPLELTLQGFRSYREPTTFDVARPQPRGHRGPDRRRASPPSSTASRSRCSARPPPSSATRSR